MENIAKKARERPWRISIALFFEEAMLEKSTRKVVVDFYCPVF